MADFIDTEIKTIEDRLDRAQTLFHLAIEQDRWGKVERLGAEISTLRHLRFVLSMTRGLDIRLVLLDALVTAADDLEKRALGHEEKMVVSELIRMIQRHEWHDAIMA